MKIKEKAGKLLSGKTAFLRAASAISLLFVAFSAARRFLFHGASPAFSENYATICPFRNITGLYCPGCGMAHALAAIGRTDFAQAFSYNPLAVPLFISMLSFVLFPRATVSFFRKANPRIILAGILVFWIVRNL